MTRGLKKDEDRAKAQAKLAKMNKGSGCHGDVMKN
jgi:hypothetical protein